MALFASIQSRLAKAHTIEDLRSIAQRTLPKFVFDFVDGAAESENTARANRRALDDIAVVPATLRDVTKRSTSVSIFGKPSRMPIIIGPTGFNSAYWPGGDLALSRAASAFGIPFVMSWGANVSMSRLCAEGRSNQWFQINLPLGQELWEPILQSVEAAGFEALEVTVDTPVPGRRLRDLRNEIAVPLRWTGSNVAQLLLRPRWTYRMARQGTPEALNVKEVIALATRHTGEADIAAKMGAAAVTWEDLKRVRDLWRRPLVIKGLTNPSEVDHAICVGCDGIVVSNHGGRQLDGAVGTAAVLLEFARESRGRIALLIDSGFRSGTDVLKALALGATAVQIGRAAVYGLAAGGQAGAERALSILSTELDTAMALSGVTSVAEAGALETRRLSSNCSNESRVCEK